MPLCKRKHFDLVEPPQDLDPKELVFQVRFTKEIFRDYQEYLNRLNIYRQRVWTCKVTGKTNLTYEEALVSERRATEKVQQIPKELMPHMLHMVQYSRLRLKDLVKAIFKKLQERLFEGAELYGQRGQSVCACRILEVFEDAENIHYKVGWFDKNKEITDTSVVNSDDLMRKKLPFSRNVLKSFIRESTSQSSPWVVLEKLARRHGVSTVPPEELRDKLIIHNGSCSIKEGQKNKDAESHKIFKKRKKSGDGYSENLEATNKRGNKEEGQPKKEPIKYPIDDLLVKPGADDPVFTHRPSPSTDFSVPMDCVGDLLMVWDFCSSFCKLLHLWPFSLEDFEKAICHKDSDLTIIIESHSAILRLLTKEEGGYFMAIQKKRRKSKITQTNWAEYLCDFLEMEDKLELSTHVGIIKRGHYGLLDVHIKLGIFRELVAEALTTDAIRQQLDEYIEQQQALAAANREEARKKREEQQLKKEESETMVVNRESALKNGDHQLNGHHILENGIKKHGVFNSMKVAKKTRIDGKTGAGKVKDSFGIEGSKKVCQNRMDKEKEPVDKKTEEQRKEHLEREIEKRFIRTNSLGRDKDYNRYWFFRRNGRLFIESSDFKQWGYYTTKEELDAFMGSLNPKGERERALKRQLEKYYSRISLVLQKRSRDIAQKILLEEAVLRRSTRVRAQPRNGRAVAFLRYVNKWKEN